MATDDPQRLITRINASYNLCSIDAYSGNPLIDALPDYLSYSKQDLIEKLAHRPGTKDPQASLRQKSDWLRRISSLLFIPLVRHLELQTLISMLILQGYDQRRPVTEQGLNVLQQTYEAQQRGEHVNVDYGGHVAAEPLSLALIGINGVGKSYAVEHILGRMYPQLIHHNAPDLGAVFDQVVYLKVEIPHDGSVKAMCYNLISELSLVTGNNYVDTLSSTITLERLRNRLISLLGIHYVGLIILDEVQNLLSAKKNKEELINFIVGLSNTIRVPIMFVGTPKILKIRLQSLRVSRRLGSMGSLMWRPLEFKGKEWNRFIRELWTQNVLTDDKADIPEDIEKILFDYSQGIPDLIVKLFVLSQERVMSLYASKAQEKGRMKLSKASISAVFDDYFGHLKPMIDILKSNDRDKIDQIEDLSLDNSAYRQAVNKEVQAVYAATTAWTDVIDQSSKAYTKQTVLRMMGTLQIEDIGSIEAMIDEELLEDPGRNPGDVFSAVWARLTGYNENDTCPKTTGSNKGSLKSTVQPTVGDHK